MKEVSIIIDGVRYDAVFTEPKKCKKCELYYLCENGDYYNMTICEKLPIEFGCIFKKSTKSFER